MSILVTGASGMIGSSLIPALLDFGYQVIGIDREEKVSQEKYEYYQVDLNDRNHIQQLLKNKDIERIIHLAALAHTEGIKNLSWEQYYKINVECARNVFESAGEIPVLYISTVDVYGFYDGKEKVTTNTPVRPVSKYGKSKALAEEECRKLPHYSIFRLSPVYTDSIKRDIQKRYYLKYPQIAYRIGKGSCFEILNIRRAVEAMVTWCSEEPDNDIHILKDQRPMWTPEYIESEKKAGRANHILIFPKWMVSYGYTLAKIIFGENEKTYLLNKAVYPLQTES